MTRVLVVTDNERVQNVFEELQNTGVLTLCTVSNLMQSDEQIANFRPEFTFVQSRLSGLSGDLILRHLKKLLPPKGKTVLLALDAQDAAQGRKQGARIVELSEAREGLAEEITTVLQGESDQLRKRKSAGQAVGTRRPRGARKGDAAEVAATLGDCAPLAGEGGGEQPALAGGSHPEEAAEREADPAPYPSEAANDALSAAETTGDAPVAATFAEMMRRAEETTVAGAGVVEDTVDLGSRREASPLSQPIRPLMETTVSDGSPRGGSGVGGVCPEHRSKRHPLWTFPLVLIVILLPLLYLLPSEKAEAPQATPAPAPVPAQTAAPVPQSKAAPQVAPAKPIPTSNNVPLAPTPPPFQGESRSGDGVKTAQDSRHHGLRELPPFLQGVTLDHAYAKAHPGWQRYIGARAEYKLYQEGGAYRALQVIALTGQAVPDEIFKKALQEFGGIDSYQVQSTERKQHFLIEHGRAGGNIAVTVYRRMNDRRVKGLVLYYMK